MKVHLFSRRHVVRSSARKVVRAARSSVPEPLEPRLLMSYTQSTPSLTLFEPTSAASDQFGKSLSAVGSGDLFVGSPNKLVGTHTNAGQVYRFNAATGALEVTAVRSTPANTDETGWSVATSGNDVAAGAPQANGGAVSSGSAFLFDGGTGGTIAMLAPSPAHASSADGTVIAATATRVLVGAPSDSTYGSTAGAAYLLDRAGHVLATYYPPTGYTNGRFGSAVAFANNGSTVVIGAYGDGGVIAGGGAVYTFDASLTGTVRTPLRTFTAPGTIPTADNFGRGLATDGGSTLIVGAAGDNTGATKAGAAFMFDVNTGAYIRAFYNPTPASTDAFGTNVAISSTNRVLIGVPMKDSGSIADAGAAYIFDTTSGALTHTFLNPTPAASEQFGGAVAFVGNNVAIGTPYETTKGASAGAVYIFTPSDAAPTAAAGSYAAVNEGATVTLNGGGSTDPDGASDIVSYKWDLNNDGVFETVGQTTPFTEPHGGVYPVALQVTDRAGATSTSTVNITFNHLAPTANAGSAQTVNEGDTVSLTGTASASGGDSIVSYEWDYNYNGTTFNSTGSGSTPSTVYADNGAYTVALRVTDSDGFQSIATTTVTVNNVAPTASVAGPLLGFTGTELDFTGAFTDPGSLDTHTVSWNFGDGTTIAPHSDGDTGALTPAHTYTSAGVYTVTFTVTDKDGGVGTSSLLVVVL